MPWCCHPTRRQFLRWSALVAATPVLAALDDVERAYAFPQAGANAVPMHLELVTLTESTAVLTWFTGDPTRIDEVRRPAPVPADTEVLLGTSPADLRQVFFDPALTPYHYVELTGLEPGRPYVYVARSNGVAATAAISANGNPAGTSTLGGSPAGPFTFTTPEPPPGSFLFAIALCNDLHLGETVAGLATTQQGIQIPPGITQVPGQPPYSEIMAAALAQESRQRGAGVLLAGGDLTAEGSQIDTGDAKSFLDGFGRYRESYFVARGNHDRPHDDADAAACGQGDCFADSFFPSGPTWFSRTVNGMRIIGLDTYDKPGNGGDNGGMSDPQRAFLREELARDREVPTLVFGHHPVGDEATATSVPPVTFTLDAAQGRELESLYAATPGVFLHHAGHTHRNRRIASRTAPNVVFQEVAATKEYPGGFHLLRVFTGGYALNFYKFRERMAQEWSERSRQEYGGLVPFYVFGNAADRNSVVARDFSGLARPAAAAPPPTTAPASPAGGGGTLPATGGSSYAAAGAAAAAAGAAAQAWLRRARR